MSHHPHTQEQKKSAKHEKQDKPLDANGKHDRTKHVSPAETAQNKPFNAPAANEAKKHLRAQKKENDGDGVGEGNIAASRRYDEGVAKSEARGDSDELAERAKEAYDGEEGDDLRRAEGEGMTGHVDTHKTQRHS